MLRSRRRFAALRAEIAGGRVKAADLAAGYYDRIEKKNPHLNVYLSLTKERALAQAARIDALAAKGDPLPPLAGIPVGIKDVLVMQGAPSTAGSKILQGYHPPYDCHRGRASSKPPARCCWARPTATSSPWARRMKTPPTGRCAIPSIRSAFPADRAAARPRPSPPTWPSPRWAPTPAAPFASPPAFAAWSACCPPTAASRATASSPLLLRSIASAPSPPTCATPPRCSASSPATIRTTPPVPPAPVEDYAAESDKPVAGLRIGVPAEYFAEGLDPEVRAAIEKGIAALEAAGCTIKPVSLPHTKYAVPTYYLVATAEASANLARFDGVRYGYRSPHSNTLSAMYSHSRDEGFGAEVKRRILLGTYALSAGYYDAYYLKAQQVRRLLAEEFLRAFAEVDAIVTPTSPVPAFKIGEKTGDPLAMYLADIYTVTASLAGICGVTVPCGNNQAPACRSACRCWPATLARARRFAWRAPWRQPAFSCIVRSIRRMDQVSSVAPGVGKSKCNAYVSTFSFFWSLGVLLTVSQSNAKTHTVVLGAVKSVPYSKAGDPAGAASGEDSLRRSAHSSSTAS